MQLVAATQNMGLLVIVSLLLIVGGGGRKHLSFVDAAATTPKPETLITYWEAVLPGVPVPPAISDLFGQQNGLSLPLSPSPCHSPPSLIPCSGKHMTCCNTWSHICPLLNLCTRHLNQKSKLIERARLYILTLSLTSRLDKWEYTRRG
jgi:hypothetical protein